MVFFASIPPHRACSLVFLRPRDLALPSLPVLSSSFPLLFPTCPVVLLLPTCRILSPVSHLPPLVTYVQPYTTAVFFSPPPLSPTSPPAVYMNACVGYMSRTMFLAVFLAPCLPRALICLSVAGRNAHDEVDAAPTSARPLTAAYLALVLFTSYLTSSAF